VAITRACEAAGVEHFHPHQVRHLHATEVRRRYGLEAAQVLLGHSRADVTQVYAAREHALAERVAAEKGWGKRGVRWTVGGDRPLAANQLRTDQWAVALRPGR